MIKNTSIYIVFIFLITVLSCRSTKRITASGELDKNLSTRQLVKQVNRAETNFETLVGKLRIETIQGSKSQSYSVSVRIEKDKTIWLSKLGIVKAIITPNRVAFYNKLDNSYFDGDFSYLSELLGTELDFEKVQNMLLGKTIYPTDAKNYRASLHEKSYVLQPKEQRELFEIFFLINPSHFKVDSQQISQPKDKRFLEVNYDSYQNIEEQLLPKEMTVIALDDETELQIKLELKGIDLNRDIKFPFTIPSGFEKIEF